MGTMSVSLSGEGSFPVVQDAVNHAYEKPQHTTVLHLTVSLEMLYRSVYWMCQDCDAKGLQEDV